MYMLFTYLFLTVGVAVRLGSSPLAEIQTVNKERSIHLQFVCG